MQDVDLINEERLDNTEAKRIIAVHGAALANLVFCFPKTQVIEIFHPDFFLHCYQVMCVQNNLSYQSLVAQSAGDPQKCDVTVNLADLSKLLET